jgi:MSHA biogenesis protein MshL
MDKNSGIKIALLLILITASGCATKKADFGAEDEKAKKERVQKVRPQNSKGMQAEPNATVEHPEINTLFTVPPPALEPTYKEIDPFEGRTFSMSAVDAPLTRVLYAMAQGAGLNLIISPEVDTTKTITGTFTNVPLREALDIVMDMTGLYYEVRGNVLYVKELMTKTFRLPYVNTVSDYSSSLGGDVLGGAIATGGATGGTAGTAGTAGAGGSGLRGNFTLDYRTSGEATDFYKQLEENVKSLLSDKGKYVLNRFTGTLVVTDRKRNVEKVEILVRRLRKEIGKQVLIEARIVELALTDEFQLGIDWSLLLSDVLGSGVSLTLSQGLSLDGGGYLNLNVVSGNFSTLVNALSQYGKVHTLSNPRILVSNGQTALIATGRITPFFERQAISISPGTAPTQVTENILRTNILEGIVLGVTPYIDDAGNIVMNIVPVATRLEGTKRLIENGRVLAEAPILNVKETGTIIRVRDGQLVIIGGLIGDINSKTDEKVPLLGDIPFVGNLFKRKRMLKEKRELIIFIKPTLVAGHSIGQ